MQMLSLPHSEKRSPNGLEIASGANWVQERFSLKAAFSIEKHF